jgi:hypothetical protein
MNVDGRLLMVTEASAYWNMWVGVTFTYFETINKVRLNLVLGEVGPMWDSVIFKWLVVSIDHLLFIFSLINAT